uniref:Uncharacterized protein n=1 Tax=Anopheles epiroticus TaxID=199890 RepID=A0A182PQZ2_9DIPT
MLNVCSVCLPDWEVLPEHPVVLSQWGQQLNSTKLGPKEEGDDIVLTCRVVGGIKQRSVVPSGDQATDWTGSVRVEYSQVIANVLQWNPSMEPRLQPR